MTAALDISSDPFADVFGAGRSGRSRPALATGDHLELVSNVNRVVRAVWVAAGDPPPFEHSPTAADAGNMTFGDSHEIDRVALYSVAPAPVQAHPIRFASADHGLLQNFTRATIVCAAALKEEPVGHVGIAPGLGYLPNVEVRRLAAWLDHHDA